MRILSILIVIALFAWASLAQAEQRQIIVTNQIDGHTQLAASDIDDDAVEEAVEDSIDDTRKAVDEAQKAITKGAEDTQKLVDRSRKSVEQVAKDLHASTGISPKRAVGIVVGMVAGAVVVDLMGGGGLATLAAVAGGGLIGNWIMSDSHDEHPVDG